MRQVTDAGLDAERANVTGHLPAPAQHVDASAVAPLVDASVI